MQTTKRKTKEEFIEEARAIHGNKYDYSKVEYKNNKTDVCIICLDHGEFWQTPNNHLSKRHGCPICNQHNYVDTNIFVKKLRDTFGEEYDYSKVEYIDYYTKVCLVCPEHGEFWQSPSMLMKGYGCSKCKRNKTKEQYWEWRKCPICGGEFYVRKKYEKITCSEECYKKYVELHKEEINEKRSKSLKKTFSSMSDERKREIQRNREKTFLANHGTTKPNQSEEYRERMSKIQSSRDWSFRSEKYKNEVLIPKYREICERDNLTLLEFRNRFDCTVKCNKCGEVFDVHVLGYLTDAANTALCRTCHPPFNYRGSHYEDNIENILKEYGVGYRKNDRRTIFPYEIDFLLLGFKIGIEINGNYFHSSEGGKDKNYHLMKTKKAFGKGVKIIHIFEDESAYRFPVVKSMIERICGKSKIVDIEKCSIVGSSIRDIRIFF